MKNLLLLLLVFTSYAINAQSVELLQYNLFGKDKIIGEIELNESDTTSNQLNNNIKDGYYELYYYDECDDTTQYIGGWEQSEGEVFLYDPSNGETLCDKLYNLKYTYKFDTCYGTDYIYFYKVSKRKFNKSFE